MRRSKVLRQPLGRLLTVRATQALDLAREEVAAHEDSRTSPEHLLLGLIRLNAGVAIYTLSKLGISIQAVRDEVERHIGRDTGTSANDTAFSATAQQVLQLARREAYELGHRYLGTEHLLLGLLRDGGSAAARALTNAGVTLPDTRRQIIALLQGPVPADWR